MKKILTLEEFDDEVLQEKFDAPDKVDTKGYGNLRFDCGCGSQHGVNEIGIEILNISDFNDCMQDYINFISKLKFTNNWTTKMLEEYLTNPLHYGAVMVAMDDADGMVAGAINSTADVIRTAIRIIGVSPQSKWISSIFLMVHPDEKLAYTFCDCGVIPEPTPEQSVSIAKNASEFHYLLTENDPKIAFLSFSTNGSSDHYRVKKVQDAVRQFSKKYPLCL